MAKTFPTKTYNGDWWLLPATVKVKCPQIAEVVEVRPAVRRNLIAGTWEVYFEYTDDEGYWYEWFREVDALTLVEWIGEFGWEKVETRNQKLGDGHMKPRVSFYYVEADANV